MQTIIVSACMMGKRCRWHGEIDDSLVRRVNNEAVRRGVRLVPACPEMLAGLSCPRPPARRYRGRVYLGTVRAGNRRDATEIFEAGATKALRLARRLRAREAWLYWRSPSCDPEYGIAALLFRRAGIKIIGWGFPGIWRLKKRR